MKNIIFFDGVCNICDYTVEFVLKHDHDEFFKFSSLQSDFAINYFKKNKIDITLDTVILQYENKIYFRSDALIIILKNLEGYPRFLGYGISFLPKFFRDFCYSVFAKYRYYFFGKKTICKIPNQKDIKRFYD